MKAAVLNAFGEPLAIGRCPTRCWARARSSSMSSPRASPVTPQCLQRLSHYLLDTPVVQGRAVLAGCARRDRIPPAESRRLGLLRFDDPLARRHRQSEQILLAGPTGPRPRGRCIPTIMTAPSPSRCWCRPRTSPDRRDRSGGRGPLDRPRRLLVPFGGLLAGDLKAGETIVVNGATGASAARPSP